MNVLIPLFLQALALVADGAAETRPATADAAISDRNFIQSEGYLAAHPDQRYRLLGMQAQQAGRAEQARTFFRRGARYADKLSQAAYAEMLWSGEGGPADRALAYVWMDLAAERGTPPLLALRERYWEELAPQERRRALHEGGSVHAEFRDAVAKPRLERLLRRGIANMTGSRAGWSLRGDVCVEDLPQGGCSASVPGEYYYAERHWKPDIYWQWQDQLLLGSDREGSLGGPVQASPRN